MVRTTGDPARAAGPVIEAMRGFDRDVPVHDVRTFAEVFASSIGPRRFPTLFLGQFSLAALVLAGLGIFGLMTYAVAQRTHEVGVRIALGARNRDVVRELLGESLRARVLRQPRRLRTRGPLPPLCRFLRSGV